MEIYWLTLIPIPFLGWLLIELVRDEAIPIPLPKGTIRQMLKMAKVGKGDVVYDLGSGDGRVVRIASKEFGAKAVGIEKNMLLVWLSRRLTESRIIHGDIFKEDLGKADVVVMYLSHKVSQQLKEKFEKELQRGTRIVSASHPIDGWKATRRLKTGHFYSYLYKV